MSQAAVPQYDMMSILQRLDIAASRLEALMGPGPGNAPQSAHSSSTAALPAIKAAPASTAARIAGIDAIINDKIKPWTERVSSFGDDVLTKQAEVVLRAFSVHRDFVEVAPDAARPASAADASLLKELGDLVMEANDVSAKNRSSPFVNHLRLLADSLQALNWILYEKPPEFIRSVSGDARIWENKVRLEYKGNAEHENFVEDHYRIYDALAAHTKKYFAAELDWNPTGRAFADCVEELRKSKSAGHSAPSLSSTTKSTPQISATDFNQSNTSLRASTPSSIKRPHSPVPPIKPKPASMRVKKPLKVETEHSKKSIFIDHAESEKEPVQVEVPFGYSVMINDCNNSTIILAGKVNAIQVNECKKLSLLADNVISTVDVVNSKNFQFQAKGAMNGMQLDRVDSARIYLKRSNTSAAIHTSACVGVNIELIPDENDEAEESIEYPLPEQFITTLKDGKLVTEVYKHA